MKILKSKVIIQKAKQKVISGRWSVVSAVFFLTLCLCASVVNIHAQTTEFTYQGRLLDSALPPTANYDFEFSLWDALANGTQQGTTQTVTGVAVTNGIFTVRLNFGAQFSGPPRFLQMAMRPAGGPTYTTLAPRQPITSVPYAVKSTSADVAAVADTATTANNAQNLGGISATQYVQTTDPRLSDARSPTPGSSNYIQNSDSQQASSNFNISGSGTAGGTLSGNVVNTATDYNVSGSRVLSVTTSGDVPSNVFVGVATGTFNTGFNNTFGGYGAGNQNTLGGDNSFFGRFAGFSNSSGSNNTFVGALSGGSNVGGSSNTLLGSATNVGSDNLSFATAIGAGSTASANNTIVLGRSGGLDTVVVPGTLNVTGAINGTVTNALTANSVSGVVAIANGGTGSATKNFIDLSTNQFEIGGNKNFSGNISVSTATGVFSGNGSGLTNVDAAKLGTFPAADYTRFKWNVVAGNQQSVSNNGYVFDTSAAVEVTLPQSPAIGDIVRVVLTGGGSFLVKPNPGQVVARPEDLTASWIDVGPGISWVSISMSADGTKLFAAPSFGAPVRSIDSGQTWTSQGQPREWFQVVSTAGGGRVYAVEKVLPSGANLHTSNDSGFTWSSAPLPGAGKLASSADGTYLALTSFAGRIHTSTDSGVTWTARETTRQWNAIASSANGLKLVATVLGGQLYTSTDAGENWTPRDTNRNWSAVASSADGSVLAATTQVSAMVFISTDSGVTWNERLSPGFNTNIHCVTVSSDGRKIAVAVNSGLIYLSSDFGLTWNSPPKTGGWVSIASSADGNSMAAAAFGSGGTPIYLRRSNNFTGGVRGYGSIELIHMGGGKFLIVNSVGTLTFQ